MTNEERGKMLYDDAYQYLLNNTDGLTREMLNVYLVCGRQTTLDGVFWIAVNYVHDMYAVRRNVLLYGEENFSKIEKLLRGGDLSYFLQNYSEQPDKLFQELHETLEFRDADSDHTLQTIRIYVNVLCGMAEYLSQFENVDAMYARFDRYQTCKERIELVHTIQAATKQCNYLQEKKEGWGFALAANWLKDIGMEQFCKPDRHVKDFSLKLKLTDHKTEEPVFRTFVTLFEEAKQAYPDISVFKADRLAFLIGSGDFYSHRDQVTYHGSMEDFAAQELPKLK